MKRVVPVVILGVLRVPKIPDTKATEKVQRAQSFFWKIVVLPSKL